MCGCVVGFLLLASCGCDGEHGACGEQHSWIALMTRFDSFEVFEYVNCPCKCSYVQNSRDCRLVRFIMWSRSASVFIPYCTYKS